MNNDQNQPQDERIALYFTDRAGKEQKAWGFKLGEGASGTAYRFKRPPDCDLPGDSPMLVAKVAHDDDPSRFDALNAEVARDPEVINRPHQIRQTHICMGRADEAQRAMSFAEYGGKTLSLAIEGRTDENGLPIRRVYTPEETAATVVTVTLALRPGFVHRDIKPENIVVSDNGDVKLIDFGAECEVGRVGCIRGSPGYLAPETNKAGYLGRLSYSEKQDGHCLGVLLYELSSGKAYTDAEPMSPFSITDDGKRPCDQWMVEAIGDAARRNDPATRWDPVTIAAHTQFLMTDKDRNRLVGREHAPAFAAAIGKAMETETDPRLNLMSTVAGKALLEIPGVDRAQLRSLMGMQGQERALKEERVQTATPIPSQPKPLVQRPPTVVEEPESEAPVRPRHVMSR